MMEETNNIQAETTEIVEEAAAAEAPAFEETEEIEEVEEAKETEEAEAPPSPEALLAEAEAKAAEHLAGWQRERAEFTNYKRRVERERAEIYQNAKIDVLAGLLPLLDDFERAMENVPEDLQGNDWTEGIGMIARKMHNLLESLGVTEIEALGQPFDPNFHEAISRDESDDYESDHVMDVLQKGYRHGNRVLRPAVVRVAL
jgi:molecular chaperone GrpE